MYGSFFSFFHQIWDNWHAKQVFGTGTELLICIWLFVTPVNCSMLGAPHLLLIRNLSKFMFIAFVTYHLILCHTFLLVFGFSQQQVFYKEPSLLMRWSKYLSFSIWQKGVNRLSPNYTKMVLVRNLIHLGRGEQTIFDEVAIPLRAWHTAWSYSWVVKMAGTTFK